MPTRKSVPPNILFGFDILLTPSLTEVGIGTKFGRLGPYELKVGIGDWVDRGQTLLTSTYSMFLHDKKPSWPRKDETRYEKFQLTAPIAGLVIGLRKEYVGYFSEYAHATTSGNPVVYGEKELLPVMLVPRDEPPQNAVALTFFFQIGATLRDNWQRVLYSHRDRGYIRMKELLAELNTDPEWAHVRPEWEAARRAIEAFKGPTVTQFTIRPVVPSDQELLYNIQQLRTQDLTLRDKLIHLVRVFQ